jgi:hypothetical protein
MICSKRLSPVTLPAPALHLPAAPWSALSNLGGTSPFVELIVRIGIIHQSNVACR